VGGDDCTGVHVITCSAFPTPTGLHQRNSAVDGLQTVRPVDRRGHARLERLPSGEEIVGVDVLGPERLAVLRQYQTKYWVSVQSAP
jgi:hypothetical protein